MKIKRKLSLGLLFLFGVIILLIALAVFYVTKLSNVSEEVLKDNDISIEYVDRMLQALDHSKTEELDKALSLQEKNITEPGEAEMTQQAREYFEHWRKNPNDLATISLLRDRLHQIAIVNRAAIHRKNEVVQSAAAEARIWLGVIGTICFIVSFTIIINFPGYIANPISKLTESIKQIARKNYEERLHFNSEDEFGELSEAFNSMAEKLDEYESSNLSSILFEKKRIETIINKMHDPLIGLDEKRNVIFANNEALKILGIEEKELLGKYAPDVALKNDLLRNLIKDIISTKQLPENAEPVKIIVDGKENYFSKDLLKISNVPTGEKKSILIGFVILLRNITPFKELDLAKTNFIATVSHELKTPIASIQMCTQLLSAIAQQHDTSSVTLKFIGEQVIPYGNEFDNTIVGGLSGIDYNPQAGVYYLLSDDGKARFYTARIDFDLSGFKQIQLLEVHALRQPDGKPFYFPDRNTSEIDPEAIAVDPSNKLLLWTSEGERIVNPNKNVLIDPAIYISSLEGKFIETIPLPANLVMNPAEHGPRKNGTLEGLTFAKGYKTFYISIEEPLMEDGPRASLNPSLSWIRIFQFDAKTKKNVAQYAYQLEPIAHPSHPADAFKVNGVSEIHSLNEGRLLVIERSYSTGRDGCTIKIFQADLRAATDVKNISSLKERPPVNPVKKKLVLNMESLGRHIDNIEGVTFGPDFPNGHKSLIFVSDNNFSEKQKTQFLLFEMIP